MIIAGFGCRNTATPDSLQDAYDRARGVLQADCFATIEAKVSALEPLAAHLGLPVVVVSTGEARAQSTMTHSRAALEAYGVKSVAEAAALAAAGPAARLLAPRAVSADRRATCALATGETA